MDFEKVFQLLTALEREGVQYVLVGGVALNLHGILRATQDIDLFVRPTKANVERLKRALRAVWDDPEIAGIREEDLSGDYPTVRYGPPGETLVVDLMSRLGTAFRYEDILAENILVNGTNVCIATPAMLFRMKKNTLRLIDQADAAELREKFDLGEG